MDNVELTKSQAVIYLADLACVLSHLSDVLAAVGRMATETPECPPLDAMCEALVGSWESLDNRFREVYAAVYGHDAQDDDPPTVKPSAEARMGPEELLGR